MEMFGRRLAEVALMLTLPAAVSSVGCGSPAIGDDESNGAARSPLDTVPLIITEVAQSTLYGGTTADKVEVFCTNADDCSAYKVCDTTATGSSCSALQAALRAQQRAVVSRGTSITTTDEVWLADSAGVELTGTRVGPFACGSGLSQSRADCSIAAFGA